MRNRISSITPFIGAANAPPTLDRFVQADVKTILIQRTPPDQPRGAIILPMEHNLWQVSAVGMCGDYAPTDVVLQVFATLPASA